MSSQATNGIHSNNLYEYFNTNSCNHFHSGLFFTKFYTSKKYLFLNLIKIKYYFLYNTAEKKNNTINANRQLNGWTISCLNTFISLTAIQEILLISLPPSRRCFNLNPGSFNIGSHLVGIDFRRHPLIFTLFYSI